jgi:phosphate:Na+ symporter
VCKILPVKENDEDTRLRYITGGLLSTAELSVLEAQKEIALYAQRTRKMFGFVQE